MTKEEKKIIQEILFWKEKRRALILAHNYQIPSIQDLADFVGDSLELTQRAAWAKEKIIVFCGVYFMAESAAIFSPEKIVLLPEKKAGCSLAAMITASELRKWKKRYPKALVVAYINTTAEVKAEADYCCTSTNAVKIINSLPKERPILFLPDMFLGEYVARLTGRKNMIIYPGECHIHAKVKPQDIQKKMKKYPEADFLIHPECGCVTSCLYRAERGDFLRPKTYILSTGGMVKHAKNSPQDKFIIATETGLLYRLKKENPQKKFYPVRKDMICPFMKMITLPKVLNSLKNLEFPVKVPKEIAERARRPIERMLKLSS